MARGNDRFEHDAIELAKKAKPNLDLKAPMMEAVLRSFANRDRSRETYELARPDQALYRQTGKFYTNDDAKKEIYKVYRWFEKMKAGILAQDKKTGAFSFTSQTNMLEFCRVLLGLDPAQSPEPSPPRRRQEKHIQAEFADAARDFFRNDEYLKTIRRALPPDGVDELFRLLTLLSK